MPGIYYGGLPKTQLSSTYLAFLEKALTPHSTHFTEDTAELKISNPLISSTHINTKLKNWLDNRFVGSITVEKLQAQ
ncbi:hypothetical protein, partial [Staphylococcus aureus]|uniref:hypothetical protein n=1 Tax=Staphylococcus aureus TaxID=1280 RepID=UPI001C82AD1F